MSTISAWVRWCAAALVWSIAVIAQAADTYPNRPIRVIVPYSAGSTGENIIRLLAPKIEAELGQKLVIEPRPGAGGNVGGAFVANSPPDGYTLLMGATNNFAINQFVYKSMPFDPVGDLAPISKVVDFPYVMYGSSGLRARTLAEFVAEAKARPGQLFYASSGNGTAPHLAGVLLAKLAGIDITHVPYAGNPQSIRALLANEVQVYFASVSAGQGNVGSGENKLHVIVAAWPTRVPEYPDVPSAGEAGMAGLKVSNWWGLAAPKGTPDAVLNTVSNAVAKALRDPEIMERFRQSGFPPVGSTPTQFRESIAADVKFYGDLVKSAGIQAE